MTSPEIDHISAVVIMARTLASAAELDLNDTPRCIEHLALKTTDFTRQEVLACVDEAILDAKFIRTLFRGSHHG